MEQCLEHACIKEHTALIPQIDQRLVAVDDKMDKLIVALNGAVGQPGWMTKQELRVSSLEDQVKTIMRILWGIGGTLGVAIVLAVIKLVLR